MASKYLITLEPSFLEDDHYLLKTHDFILRFTKPFPEGSYINLIKLKWLFRISLLFLNKEKTQFIMGLYNLEPYLILCKGEFITKTMANSDHKAKISIMPAKDFQ